MVLALQKPQSISALIAVDNAPVDAALSPDFAKYIQAMQSIESAGLTKSSEADQILQEYEKALPIRQFLLTNLVRLPGTHILGFRIPVKTLAAALVDMAGFPFSEQDGLTYEGPALFIRGSRSHYVKDSTLPSIQRFFPNYQLRDVSAGHWVMAENPEAFKRVVVDFLQ
ncbi:hypothetical protein FQN54_007403 [Arachnomyces sp. PD_36]|nr:hypothetical protein FQN54_007403 [Arachnomyces sp. PD_36]